VAAAVYLTPVSNTEHVLSVNHELEGVWNETSMAQF